MPTEKMKYRETTTLPTGHTVVAGQLVEVWLPNSGSPSHAVIVDWSDSGKTITLHKCAVRFYENGTERITLYKTDGTGIIDPRRVIRKFRLRAGRKGASVAYRNSTESVHFDLGS